MASDLIYACKRDDLETVEQILADGWMSEYSKALPIAAGYGHLRIVERLREHPIDPEIEQLALGNAAKYGRYEMVKRLIETDGIEPDRKRGYGFCYAAKNNHLAVVCYYIEALGFPADFRDNLPLRVAAESGAIRTVAYLCEHGADPNTDSGAPLYYAAELGSIEMVQHLQSAGGLVFDEMLTVAARNRNFELVRWLLDRPEIDPTHRESLVAFYAVKYHDLETVERLGRIPAIDWGNRDGAVFEMARGRIEELIEGYTKVTGRSETVSGGSTADC